MVIRWERDCVSIQKTTIIHLQDFIMKELIALQCWHIIQVISSGGITPLVENQTGAIGIGKWFKFETGNWDTYGDGSLRLLRILLK